MWRFPGHIVPRPDRNQRCGCPACPVVMTTVFYRVSLVRLPVNVMDGSMREWRNRQTRTVQVRVPARAWGFNSPLAHPSRMIM